MFTRFQSLLIACMLAMIAFAPNDADATLRLSTTTRTAMVNAIGTELDADNGSNSAATLYICSGSKVACSSYVAGTACTGGTTLAVLTASAPAGSASSGTYTFSAITQDSSADATGTAAWFMWLDQPNDASAECIYTGDVSTSSSDLNLNTTSIVSGAIVSVTSATITAPNS